MILIQQLGKNSIPSILLLFTIIFVSNIGYSQIDSKKVIERIFDSAYERDQTLRLKIVEIEENWKEGSKDISDSLWRLVKVGDSLNLKILQNIQDKYGWESLMKLDDTTKSTIFLIIQHADSIYQKRYLPLILKAVKSGDLPPRYFALLKDRVQLKRNGHQYYGTQYFWDNRKKRNILFPFQYRKKKVKKMRKKLGLVKLKTYIKFINR